MKFFTADIHFCDPKSMRADFRPFKNIKQYDKFIIHDWKSKTKAGDTIYVIGDLLDCNGPTTTEWKQGLELIKKSKIKADIILIMGNNEERVVRLFFGGNYKNFVKTCLEYGIKEVHKTLDVEFAGRKFHLVHQIVEGNKNKFNLFGHTHLCSGLYHPYGLCLSTDLNHFRLFTEEIILSYIKRKIDYWEPDDNTNYINPFLKEVDGEIINIKKLNNKVYKDYEENNKVVKKIKKQ